MKKVETLFRKQEKSLSEMNIFEKEMFKEKHQTVSGNGSIKYTTSGNIFLDDFAAISNYRQLRELDDIFATIDTLYKENPLLALKESVYIRLITRAPFFKDKKLGIHRGQGLKYEYISRLLYFAIKNPNMFIRNLDIYPAVGSWNDLFELLRMDLYYGNLIDKHIREQIIEYISCKVENDKNQSNLIKKYLPQIKPSKKCTTLRTQANNIIAKEIANSLFAGDKASVYAAYRHLKTSGTAHSWEQLISQERFKEIDFSLVAGRALKWMVDSNFLKNHDLEKDYEEWIESQPIAKFTGYVYELFKPIQNIYSNRGYNPNTNVLKPYQIKTLNKQFDGLIDTAKQNMNCKNSFICCIDTSGSMTSEARGTGVTALGVARSMALYFSELLEGPFKNTFLEFESHCTFNTWKGKTAYEKWIQTPISGYCGSTNFLSVAHTLCELKQKGYQENEFPTGIICISDGEFDPNYAWKNNNESTFESFLNLLRNAGFSDKFVDNFKIVLWDIPNSFYGNDIRPKFESLGDRPNFYYMSGLDPAGIAFLLGTEYTPSIPKTAEELFEAAMNQELIQKIK